MILPPICQTSSICTISIQLMYSDDGQSRLHTRLLLLLPRLDRSPTSRSTFTTATHAIFLQTPLPSIPRENKPVVVGRLYVRLERPKPCSRRAVGQRWWRATHGSFTRAARRRPLDGDCYPLSGRLDLGVKLNHTRSQGIRCLRTTVDGR